MLSITPVILSGGSGTRLWPSSRSLYPKQFLKLTSESTMLQETALRLNQVANVTSPVVIANNEHRFLAAEQLMSCGLSAREIILEPVGRNTAPAIALAAIALEASEDTVMLVLPADHSIKDEAEFAKAIETGRLQAEEGKLVTFGVIPESAHTGYGYIKSGEQVIQDVFSVESFVEKPDIETAKKYYDTGSYTWNSGIFMFKPTVYLEELSKYQPEILSACRASIDLAQTDLDFLRVDHASFLDCPSDSIDYAVMEQTTNAVVIPMAVGWSDVGSWSALWENQSKDEFGNVTVGDVMTENVNNSLIISDKKLIAAVGVRDIVLVESDDAILLVGKDSVQDVKGIVQRLIANDRPEAQLHRKVYRPWGFYDSIESDEGYQVKRLVVYPGAELSLQMHHHRAEHWVVVKGTAEVINGEHKILMHVNESTYIPLGVKHQLKNPGKIQLELIEVQSGDYLGEDDIVRFNDIYGRETK